MKFFPRGLLRGVCALILSMGLCLNAAAKENTSPLVLPSSSLRFRWRNTPSTSSRSAPLTPTS